MDPKLGLEDGIHRKERKGRRVKAPSQTPIPTSQERNIKEVGASNGTGRIYSALGNKVRRQILTAISGRNKTITELANELGFHSTTLRYHLEVLMSQNLVEDVEMNGSKTIGRPARAYRAIRSTMVHGFPERRYEVIVDLVLHTLLDAIGLEEASKHLSEKARASGKMIIEQLAGGSGVTEWGPESFERVVLKGAFQDFGVINQVISRSKDRLNFRVFNCPFLEVALNSPDMICDSLDIGLHKGIDEAAGGATTKRFACLGHGDPFCEYEVSWLKERRTVPSRENGTRKNGRHKKGRSAK